MMAACLATHAHYLDITGEISVFEHARTLDAAARAAGIVICSGVGFDVIPTDCVAAALKAALPDATHLALGFDSRSGFSPGTTKTSVEGLALQGAQGWTHHLAWLLAMGVVQNFLKRRIEKTVKGPSVAKRDAQPAFVWGEVTNAQGDNRTAQIKTANGYSLTVTGALAVVEHDPCLLNYTACGDGPHMRPRTARQSSPDQGRLPPIAVSEEA
jgi:short subunit dehydrogenase-like uncharacterized protein